MANIIEYLTWRGEFGFEITPWNPVDALIVATLSYLGFDGVSDGQGRTLAELKEKNLIQEGHSANFPERKRLFLAMADSARFRDCRVHHYIKLTDADWEMQFSAMCVDMPDGTMCVAFRGTDNTIVGWREDFNMAYQTIVPGQEAAVYYMAQAAEYTDRSLRLVGHSKGGNLAVYAASGALPEVQERIESIWAFDAPGMNSRMAGAEGYLKMKGKIHAFIPQTSIIGLLMEYFTPYTVVRSNALGIGQHDSLTWQVLGAGFETAAGGIDHTAVVIRDTLHELLENSTPEQRGAFVDAMFQYVESTNATRLSDLTNEKLKSLMVMMGSRKEVDPEARRVFTRLMAQAVTLGMGNVLEQVRSRREETEEKRDAAAGKNPVIEGAAGKLRTAAAGISAVIGGAVEKTRSVAAGRGFAGAEPEKNLPGSAADQQEEERKTVE